VPLRPVADISCQQAQLLKLENDALFLQEKNDALNRASFISWKMMQ